MRFSRLLILCTAGFCIIAAVAVGSAALSIPRGGNILFAGSSGGSSDEIVFANGVRLSFASQPESPAATEAPSSDMMVDINNANQWELAAKLPGVGDTIAARIVEYRELIGGFRSVDDLIEVRGIGESKLEAIRPYCYVGEYNG